MTAVVPDPAARIRTSFAQQTVMDLIGAELAEVADGRVAIKLPYRADLCQQDGFLHAGMVTTVVDSACGYAALTRMPAEARVLSIEFKVNLLRPAVGDFLMAYGEIVRAGRTVTVCRGEAWAHTAGHDPERKQVAVMQATMMTVRSEQ